MDLIKYISTPTIIALVGAILVAVGAFWSSYLAQKRELEKEISARKFQEELTIKNEELIKKNDELVKKSEEISRLNEEITKNLLGGDSFCYVELFNLYTTNNITSAILAIMHKGKYPMYDIGIRIVDLNKFPPSDFTFEEISKNEIRFDIPTLPVDVTDMRGPVKFDNRQELNFNIFITARNGNFVELIRSKKVGVDWKTAIRVDKNFARSGKTDYRTIFEEVPEGYPLNKAGKVVWQE